MSSNCPLCNITRISQLTSPFSSPLVPLLIWQFIAELKNEIDILKSLDHPNIVKPMETFSRRRQMFIIMELCSGGDLYTRDPYTESQSGRIVGKLLSAISYMHNNKITHRGEV